MRYNLQNKQEQIKAREYLDKLIETKATVDITKKSHTRSLAQNSYLHLLLQYCALQMGCDLEEFKIGVFKALVNREMFLSKDEKFGIQYTKVRSTADLTTAEMSEAVDKLKRFASEKMDLYLPDAHEHAKLDAMHNEIEVNKQWL